MTRLYLVRHGDTYFEPHQRIKGQLDVRLDPAGRAQAQAVAEYFRGALVDAIYASQLHRTREGANLLSQATGCPVRTLPLLNERGWGLWQGLTSEDIAREHTAGRDGRDGFAPLGEPADTFADRARLFMRMVARTCPGKVAIAVTHGGIIKNAVLPVIGLTTRDRSAFTQDTGAISLLTHDGVAWRPVFLNLPPSRAAVEFPLARPTAEGS